MNFYLFPTCYSLKDPIVLQALALPSWKRRDVLTNLTSQALCCSHPILPHTAGSSISKFTPKEPDLTPKSIGLWQHIGQGVIFPPPCKEGKLKKGDLRVQPDLGCAPMLRHIHAIHPPISTTKRCTSF